MSLPVLKKILTKLDNKDLLATRVLVEKEMSLRHLSLDVGEIGEQMAIEHFNSTRGLPNLIEAPKGAKNVDALSRDGERYSIKTVMKAKKTGTVYPDRSNPDKQLFEHLLIASINHLYQLEYIYSFSWEKFIEVRAWDKRMNAWYIPVSKKRLIQGTQIYLSEKAS